MRQPRGHRRDNKDQDNEERRLQRQGHGGGEKGFPREDEALRERLRTGGRRLPPYQGLQLRGKGYKALRPTPYPFRWNGGFPRGHKPGEKGGLYNKAWRDL